MPRVTLLARGPSLSRPIARKRRSRTPRRGQFCLTLQCPYGTVAENWLRARLALMETLSRIFLQRLSSPISWTGRRARMPTDEPGRSAVPHRVNRRDFLKRVGWTTAAATAMTTAVGPGRISAQSSPSYPDWIPASPKPPKRGGSITRASAWDPPVLDPRLTNSVGLFQIASLVGNRLVRYPFSDEAANTTDLTLKGDLAESWTGSSDHRGWTFKLRHGVKWHNLSPLNGRELVAADIKYCCEQYAKEGVQAFTFNEIEGMETPDKYTVRIHLKAPNTMFPQNLAEAVSVIFPREVLEEDGDLKKRMIGTGPYILKEHTRKAKAVPA